MLPRKGIDGLIIVPLSQTHEHLLDHIKHGLPLVVVDRPCEGVDACVSSDQELGLQLLCNALKEAGVEDRPVPRARRCRHASPPRGPIHSAFKVVAECVEDSLVDIGKDSVATFKSHKLDAVVCTNGQLAEAYLGASMPPTND